MPLVSMEVVTGTNEDWIDSIKFVVDDGSGLPEDFPQLDLTGIEFHMEVRRLPPDNEVVIRGTTTDGTLAIGAAPNYGYLLINIDYKHMGIVRPQKYVADITGRDGETVRRVALIDLEVVFGVTKHDDY